MNRKFAARRQSGFTLVEIAIVLLIVGLMIGGLIAPLSSQMEQRHVSDTKRTMDEAREALFGFALRNSYLPCPAISATNGLEDRTGTACNKRYGYLPWATLGVSRLDGWNHLMGYTVTPAFSDSASLFTLKTARDITIATRDLSGQLTAATGVNDIPAAIISFGHNGYGATSDQNTIVADSGTGNIDEKANLQSSGTALIMRDPSDDARAAGGAFDDLVIWISPNILYNRMVAAQRLP
ncbi:prepilin-type N-terminal cleavage/methylation domain-containing protein [Duganella sp. FT135W]|uniref:Prepilin-type N-terminal cleavage/methylation domain-containing protein n=1 Tax=Duganella flavida TaxID=2692175 RepID=A0A6L8KGN5_9BURK|nr:prepilin-type N-terminal cleavage/methylation domain-containing protein [Duganella flavida]MYM26633.1 prepilin-type N-terminal cleavage/methylation domain-containing protein [Duganella flavida]